MRERTNPWVVLLPDQEARYLSRLPRSVRERLLQALARLESADPFASDMKQLHGRKEWRLRVGNHRILLRVDREKKVLTVVGIGVRGDVYKS